MIRLIPVVGLVIGLTAAMAWGQQPHPAKPELLANVETVKPGEAFAVGVRFKLEPKWHVYWKHAGQAGIPTEIDFALPEGFQAGPVEYPIPIKFIQPGDIIGYGYEDEVMFVTTITPPAEWSGDVVPITAKVNWLVCAAVCIPGHAELTINLPIAEAARPANSELFQTWMGRLPEPITAKPSAFITQVEVQQSERGEARNIMTIQWEGGIAPDAIDLYPAADPGLRMSDPVIESSESGVTKITYTITPLTGWKKPWPPTLEGLVVFTADDGRRRGVTVHFPTPRQDNVKQN